MIVSTGPTGLAGGNLKIVTEDLKGGGATLASFFFRYGANVYAFGYDRKGVTKYTLVDAGDARYRDEMPAILREGGVDPAAIERIILTHRHPDHCGLAHMMAKGSGARVTVHAAFRSYVEGNGSPHDRRWMGEFDPSRLQECDVEYLSPADSTAAIGVAGVDFPVLGEPVQIGNLGTLRVLTCPETDLTHSPDQLMVLWSPNDDPMSEEKNVDGLLPTDNVLCSGDLWLMRGPMFDRDLSSMSQQLRHGLRHIRSAVSGGGMPWRDPRDQDAVAKEALKKGFTLVMVKPGHGNDFLGTRLIPYGILADRDLVIALGYSMDTDTSILRTPELVPRVEDLKEQSYVGFGRELRVWLEIGYSASDAVDLLVRVYREQSGGGGLVERDRRQRRERLQSTLARMNEDPQQPDDLRDIAARTLPAVRAVA
jgi:glyoxylase-like metal-dependent hydrolase (beta-lactamase superfamily II)